MKDFQGGSHESFRDPSTDHKRFLTFSAQLVADITSVNERDSDHFVKLDVRDFYMTGTPSEPTNSLKSLFPPLSLSCFGMFLLSSLFLWLFLPSLVCGLLLFVFTWWCSVFFSVCVVEVFVVDGRESYPHHKRERKKKEPPQQRARVQKPANATQKSEGCVCTWRWICSQSVFVLSFCRDSMSLSLSIWWFLHSSLLCF